MQNEMPKGGVKELVKTPDGRKYLAKLQQYYKLDILQPSNPLFNKVYGSRLKREAEVKRKREDSAKGEWQHSADVREFEKRPRKYI